MADPVTDPELLNILNTPTQVAGPPPVAEQSVAPGAVTDPTILAQLNADTSYGSTYGSGVEGLGGASVDVAKHFPVIPTEAAKGIPIAGGFIPPTPDTTQLEKEHPGIAQGAKSVGSALALAPAMMAAPEVFGINAAAPLLTNVLAGATTGAVLGGADAAARGEPIGPAAATGSLTFGATPVVGKAIGAAFQGVLNLLGPSAEGVLKGINPMALEKASQAAKAGGLSDAQIADVIKTKGPSAFLMEYSDPMFGLGVGAARGTASEGPNPIITAFEQRGMPETVGKRVSDNLDTLLGPPQNLTQMTIEGAAQRGKDAGPLFEQFKTMKVQPTPEIKALTDDLETKLPGVFNEAKNLANARSAATGKEVAPMENFFTTGERKDFPTTESWQLVKEAIDDRIANSYVNGQPTKMTGPLVQVKQRLDNAISNANPDAAKVWTEARDTWGSQSAVMNARNAGTKAWDPGYTKDQLLEDLTNMSAPERAAYKEGARAALAEKMGNSVNGDKNTMTLLRGDNAKAKMTYLAQKTGLDPKPILDDIDNMAQEAANKKALGTSTRQEAIKSGIQQTTPNPEDLAVNRYRGKMSPHIQPFAYGTKPVQTMMERRQAGQYSAMNDALRNMMVKQGPEAQSIYRALLNYNPLNGKQAGMNTAAAVRALAQPQLPGLKYPGPAWLGGSNQ